MKRYLLFLILLCCISCKSEDADLDDSSVSFPAPSDLAVSKLTESSAAVKWKDNSDGEKGFVIERQKDGDSTIKKITVTANTTDYTDTGLEYTKYIYSVYAFYKLRNTDKTTYVYIHSPIDTPADFVAELDNKNVVHLSWKAISGNVDGYKIERKTGNGTYTLWKKFDAAQISAIDSLTVLGKTSYRLYAFYQNENSGAAECSVDYLTVPGITQNSAQVSSINCYSNYTLSNSGGEDCTVGICWSTHQNPTVSDSISIWPKKINTGTTCYSSTRNLDPSTTFYVRAFASNSKYTVYSNEIAGKLEAEPQAINLTWAPMSTINGGLPPEIKVYETSTPLNGRNFKAYYAIADMSTGNIELKTILSSTAKTPSNQIAQNTDETFYVMTNGGYFGYIGSTVSAYSMVIDRGTKKAGNITSLTRGNYVYSVTRGYFGVTKNQIPFIRWSYNDYSYNTPSQNVEGETPQKTPSMTFPSNAFDLGAYTAIGGAPVLMRNGKILIDFSTTPSGIYQTNYELLQSDIFPITARPPRTLIGYTSDNKIILFICDGRQSFSDGATLLEAARIMKGLGCTNVLNLDGGGSTAMIANGKLLNSPSDGSQRAVPAVVAFVKRK